MLFAELDNMRGASLLLALFASAAMGQVHVLEDATYISNEDSVVVEFTIRGKGLYYISIDNKYIRNNDDERFTLPVNDEFTMYLRLHNLDKVTKQYQVCSQAVNNNVVSPRVCSFIKARRI